ncbi:MAG: DUF58 domain-containing protein [Candidatus Hydrogenedentes bacterium]|nr:DUF58 domain-containing protein [Candidatus Hydrogenedentota bacterium]
MIVPRTSLIVWTAVLFLPGALAAAFVPGALTLFVLGAIAFALVATADAAASLSRLAQIDARFPEVVRLTRRRQGAIPIHLQPGKGTPRRIRIGLQLPRELESLQDSLRVELPPDLASAEVEWACLPLQRGRFEVASVYLEASSLFGWWAIRRTLPARTEIRVYPDVMRERNKLAAMFLNRGALGVHAMRRVGKGRDFEQLREYIAGDSYEDVHWKATARRSHPVTKVYQVERTQEVYVILDASRLSAREVLDESNAHKEAQLERFIAAALVLGLVAQRQGDLFGLLTFSDRVHSFIRAKNGTAHYHTVRDGLYMLQPRVVNPDFDELASFIRTRLRRRALLIFLTNLDDPVLAEQFTRSMDLLSRQHLVLVNMIVPEGVQPLFRGGDIADFDEIYDRLAGHLRWHDLREVQRVLHYRGVTMSLLHNTSLAPELVTQYINVKQRQLL